MMNISNPTIYSITLFHIGIAILLLPIFHGTYILKNKFFLVLSRWKTIVFIALLPSILFWVLFFSNKTACMVWAIAFTGMMLMCSPAMFYHYSESIGEEYSNNALSMKKIAAAYLKLGMILLLVAMFTYNMATKTEWYLTVAWYYIGVIGMIMVWVGIYKSPTQTT